MISSISQSIQWGASQALAYSKDALHAARLGGQVVSHLLKGGAFNVMGKRVAIGITPMDDPYRSLEKIDGILATFQEHMPHDVKPVQLPIEAPPAPPAAIPINPMASSVTPAIEPSKAINPVDQRAETDRQLNIFSDNLKYFIPLQTMAAIAGIQDSAVNQDILAMVIQASVTKVDGTKPTVKELFNQKYGHRLSFAQRLKIWLFNLFGTSSLFSKTLDTYLTHFLKEMRERLADSRWTEKGEIVEKLINDLIHFLDVYKNATFSYADAKEPTGSLQDYRAAAVEKMFGKSTKLLCQEFSDTLVNYLSPEVRYWEKDHFLARKTNSLLNWFTRRVIHHYLPGGVHSVLLQTNDVTKPFYLPFVQALTDSVTEQLQKLMQNLDSGTPLEAQPPIAGTQKLKDAVESLFHVTQFSKCNTQEAICQKRKEIEEKKKDNGVSKNIEREIQEGIQDSILKGLQVLLRHLAEPANSEQLFTQFCVLANISFSKGQEVTEADFQNSKDKLNLIVHTLGKRLAKEAVEENFQVTRPEYIETSAGKAFEHHQGDAKVLSKNLVHATSAIGQKIAALDLTYQEEKDILPELSAIVAALRPFSTKEQIARDLQGLPEADQEAILRPLIPIYQALEKAAPLLLALQEQQILYKSHYLIRRDLLELSEMLMPFVAKNASEQLLQTIPRLEEKVRQIAKRLPLDAPEAKRLREEMSGLRSAFTAAFEEKQKYEYFLLLKKRCEELKKAIDSNRNDHRRSAIQSIDLTLAKLPKEDMNALMPLLRKLAGMSNLAQANVAYQALADELALLDTKYQAARQEASAHIPDVQALQDQLGVFEKGYEALQKGNLTTIQEQGAALSKETELLQILVNKAQKEDLFHITPHRYYGMIGAAALGAITWMNPFVGLATFAGALYAIKTNKIEPIIKGGQERYTALMKTAAAGLVPLLALRFAPASVPAAIGSAVALYPKTAAAAAVSAAALAGTKIARDGLDETVAAGQSLVFDQITQFFESTYEFLLSGEIYQPSAKIVMNEVVTAFKK